MPEVYVSVDVEADGRLPGISSMLSLGSAAFNESGELISTFSRNLDFLPNAMGELDTLDWWNARPELWAQTRVDTQPAEKVMADYYAWLNSLPGTPVFVGYPAAYDFLFVYWYLIRFVGESPFLHRALDIKSYVMGRLRLPYSQSGKKHLPKELLPEVPHTHIAVDDAVEQGQLFMNLLKAVDFKGTESSS